MIEQIPTLLSEQEDTSTLSSIRKRKITLALKTKTSETQNYPLNRLFYDLSSIQTSRASLYEKETEKERELRLIENLNFNRKKLDKDYQDKLSVLLQSKGNKDYSRMRNNMKDIIYQTDFNHNIYLALPPNYKTKRHSSNKNNIQYTKLHIKNLKSEKMNKSSKHASIRSISKDPKPKIEKRDFMKLIPEFNKRDEEEKNNHDHLKMQFENELIDQSEAISQLNEEEQRDLFNKLRTNTHGFNPSIETKRTYNDNDSSSISLNNNNMTTLITAGNYNRKSKSKESKEEIKKMLGVVDKYFAKAELLKSIRTRKQKRKVNSNCNGNDALEGIDLFYYNAKRWDEKRKKKAIEMQREDIRIKREETKKTLKLMVDGFEKLTEILNRVKSNEHNELKRRKRVSDNKAAAIGNNTFMTSPEYYRY